MVLRRLPTKVLNSQVHDRPIEDAPRKRGFPFDFRTALWVRGGAVRGFTPWPAAKAD